MSQNLKEAHHTVNGVDTDILIHIQDLIDTPEEIPFWANKLAEKTGKSIEEATKLINHHLGESFFS